ncbi:MAG: TetR family transcriptional regulator [Pseudonocardiaceae bacterium]|nr:MAG: TetR family transcriptional regulator [Pseudonocardiaceae bacterium]
MVVEGAPSTARGRRAALDRRTVITQALRMIDEEGVESLTMRGLGRALGRDPMRLYRFAASKDELLDDVVELVLAELEVPSPATTSDWEAVLRRCAHSFRELALAHPHVVPLLVTRPLSTPLGLRPQGTLRPLEAIVDLLIEAGFAPKGALHGYRLFMGFLQGHVLNEVQEQVADPDETDDLLRLGLHRLPAKEFPRIRALAHELATFDGRAELDEGLDIVLAGLVQQLRETT